MNLLKKMMITFITLFILWSPFQALAAEESGWHYKPFARIFPMLRADPRQITTQAAIFSNPDRDNTGLSARLGIFLAAPRYYGAAGKWTWQMEFEGGVFALFENPSSSTLQSRAIDYFVGLNSSVSKGPWAAQIRLMHLSSHPGDWHISTEDPSAEVVSWEALNGRLAWRPCKEFMAYGGGTWFPTKNEDIGSSAYQFGLEVTSPPLGSWTRAFLAADFQGREKNAWTPATSVQLGLNLGREQDPAQIKFFLFYFTGHSPVSAFLDTWETRFGFGFGVDW